MANTFDFIKNQGISFVRFLSCGQYMFDEWLFFTGIGEDLLVSVTRIDINSHEYYQVDTDDEYR